MKRRDFLRAASVPAAAATASAAAGVTAAQESGGTTTSGGGSGGSTGTAQGTGTGTSGGGGGGGGGATETVAVGPGGSLVFTPGTEQPLEIAPGTTVEFVWESDNHNIVVDAQPEGANWQGTPGAPSKLYNAGYTYTHTFDTLGEYSYYCQPHQTAGMVGTVVVTENPGGGGGGGEVELHELGVPIQAHWVGAATILAIIVTVIFTFYVLKYGESPNTGTGRND
jgi:plastocyanin